MKKSKLLIPFITLAGTAAVAAPVMCLTSCSNSEIEDNTQFTFSGTKATEVTSPTIAGQIQLEFTSSKEFTDEEAKALVVTAVIVTSNDNISLPQCWKVGYEASSKKLTAIVSYTIAPASYEKKATDPNDQIAFTIKISNGTWYQNFTGFTLTAKHA